MTGRELQTWAALGLAGAVVLGGCGGGVARETRQLAKTSVIESARPLAHAAVTRSEIAQTSDSAGARTVLEFWLVLQSGAYSTAASYFEPALTARVGAARLSEALRDDGALWDSTKPQVSRARVRRGTAHVFFGLRDPSGLTSAAEAQLRRLDGEWKISFLSLLQSAPPGYVAPLPR